MDSSLRTGKEIFTVCTPLSLKSHEDFRLELPAGLLSVARFAMLAGASFSWKAEVPAILYRMHA